MVQGASRGQDRSYHRPFDRLIRQKRHAADYPVIHFRHQSGDFLPVCYGRLHARQRFDLDDRRSSGAQQIRSRMKIAVGDRPYSACRTEGNRHLFGRKALSRDDDQWESLETPGKNRDGVIDSAVS
jgi:hypothetical protein